MWDDETAVFRVVVNVEEQYSIWPAERELPDGWRDVGVGGTREQCLAYVDEHWTDMRPLSLRKAMAEDRPPES
jgi:MbtH protein